MKVANSSGGNDLKELRALLVSCVGKYPECISLKFIDADVSGNDTVHLQINLAKKDALSGGTQSREAIAVIRFGSMNDN